MSDRERWIVYPVLFFAVMLGAKNKFSLSGVVEVEALTCEQLRVLGPDGRTMVQLGANAGGYATIYGANNSRIFSVRETHPGNSGELVLRGSQGSKISMKAASQSSSMIVSSGNLYPQIVVGRSATDDSYGLSSVQFDKPVFSTNDKSGVTFTPQENTAETEGDTGADETKESGDEEVSTSDQDAAHRDATSQPATTN